MSPGRRSPDWRKSPHRGTVSVVDRRLAPRVRTVVDARLGAVLVGVPDARGAGATCGRVGSGLAGKTGQALMRDG